MQMRLTTAILLLLLVGLTGCTPPASASRTLILATTTSTQDTGLLDLLIPAFEKASGYQVKVVAAGSGQALAMGARGDADVLLSHAPQAEEELVQAGVLINRQPVMWNQFILVGPPADPARAAEAHSAAEALARIADARLRFVSRADDSGTHRKEQELWKQAGVAPRGDWYMESGAGMGRTLSIASEKGAYTLTDQATFLTLKRHLHVTVLVEGDPELLNPYHVMQVNPERFGRVNGAGGAAFVAYLLLPETQAIIGRFGVEAFGEPLLHPGKGGM